MKKVLIVDDDADIRALYRLILRREGLEVIEAKSGPEALAKAKTEAPALVLLDVMMPDMNGYEVCQRLRADPQTAHLPILLISAKATPTDRGNGKLAGADDFLNKTIEPRKLVARVHQFLSTPVPGDCLAPLPASSL
jgi:CheY-like chemotaxis protein